MSRRSVQQGTCRVRQCTRRRPTPMALESKTTCNFSMRYGSPRPLPLKVDRQLDMYILKVSIKIENIHTKLTTFSLP